MAATGQTTAYKDVTLKQVDAGKDAPTEEAALQTLITQKADAIVLSPQDGGQLTAAVWRRCSRTFR